MTQALAIGRFDGMHLGHFELFKNLGQNGGILLIDTKKSNLTMPRYIARYTDLPVFTYELEELKGLGAQEFVSKLKNDFPYLKK
ncbi:MAG TPA: bifunctional riboflavin kinase/FAD synthetase, partial [Campylobacterales bacterium]|nr:bifunctional riboflavin kinase/FAD synthetase [Campylobacterales bacterium]